MIPDERYATNAITGTALARVIAPATQERSAGTGRGDRNAMKALARGRPALTSAKATQEWLTRHSVARLLGHARDR